MPPKLLVGVAVALLAAGLTRLSATEATRALTVDSRFEDQLVDVSADWTATFARQGAVGPNQLVHWGTYRDVSEGPQIVLADGSLLLADVLGMDRNELSIGLDLSKFGREPLWEDVRLPLDRLRGVLYQPPSPSADRDRMLDRLETVEGSDDQLWLGNGDVLSGTLEAPIPPGVEQGETLLAIRVRNRSIRIPESKLLAVVFNPALAKTSAEPPRAAVLGFRDGSLVMATAIESGPQQVRLTLAGDIRLAANRERFWRELCYFAPPNPRIEYVSDLPVLDYRHLPFLELEWTYRTDRNVLGGRLRCQDCVYRKGLGMHSTSRLAYTLQGEYATFEADVAVDDAAAGQGSVVFRVFVEGPDPDGKLQWTAAYESPVRRGGDPPLPVKVDVARAQRLALIVEFADRGDILDHADWLDARLIRKEPVAGDDDTPR